MQKEEAARMFVNFSTTEKADHLVASRRRWLEHQGERVALQERWQNDWEDKVCRNNDKGVSVPREKYEDAAAAAEFFVNKGGGQPLEFCGR